METLRRNPVLSEAELVSVDWPWPPERETLWKEPHMKLFEVAIVYVPKADDETEKAAKEARKQAAILLAPTAILAKDAEDAKRRATLEIPNEDRSPDRICDVEVLVRPF